MEAAAAEEEEEGERRAAFGGAGSKRHLDRRHHGYTGGDRLVRARPSHRFTSSQIARTLYFALTLSLSLTLF